MSKKSKFAPVFEQKREGGAEELSEEQPKLRGKRNHPDYTQVTAYIPRSLHEEVKIGLIREGKQDFSTLVETLLVKWVKEAQEDNQ